MDFENNGNEFLCVVVSRKTHSPKCPIGFGLVLFLEFPWAYIYCLILSIIQVFIANYGAPQPLPECRRAAVLVGFVVGDRAAGCQRPVPACLIIFK